MSRVVIRGLKVEGRVEIGLKDLFLHVNDLKLDISIERLQVMKARALEVRRNAN